MGGKIVKIFALRTYGRENYEKLSRVEFITNLIQRSKQIWDYIHAAKSALQSQEQKFEEYTESSQETKKEKVSWSLDFVLIF